MNKSEVQKKFNLPDEIMEEVQIYEEGYYISHPEFSIGLAETEEPAILLDRIIDQDLYDLLKKHGVGGYYGYYLGEDHDCETCGLSMNEIIVEAYVPEKTANLILRVGCYGGDSEYDIPFSKVGEVVGKMTEGFKEETRAAAKKEILEFLKFLDS